MRPDSFTIRNCCKALAIVVRKSSKSIGFIKKSNAPQFIAVRMFFMSP